MVELIFTEKPSAAKKIAEALADKKPKEIKTNGVPHYELTHNNQEIIVGCAVGHLFSLAEKNKKGWTYPVFDLEWKPSSEVNKNSKFSKKYLTVLKKLAKKAKIFTVATDYDQEGSVIGFNCVRYISKKDNAKRMKFSTLTKDELIKSYENASKELDFSLIESGLTRHELDFLYGISLTRALTLAVKSAGTFKILSTGRVQGPALKIIYDKEQEIKKFKPDPYWELEITGKAGKHKISAWHKESKIFDKKRADTILNNTKSKDAIVTDIKQSEKKISPPAPFDLTTLQTEAYSAFGISPKETLSIAQDLYLNGLISYPRTSSQKLPASLGLKDLIEKISKLTEYSGICNQLLKTKLIPHEGKKSDPAHPAIFATGEKPKKLTDRKLKVYDLIVRRFLATFSTEVVRESISAEIDCNKEIFIARGMRTIKKGWHDIYTFTKLKEQTLPAMEKDMQIKDSEIISHEEETKPPKRYTPSSIIKELEKRELGTKCLTEDALVIVKSDMPKSVKISDLYNESVKTNFTSQTASIALNTHHNCLSLEGKKMIESEYELVSKRKLNESEKVLQATFKDGSTIKATDKHPILCWEGNKFSYKQLKKLEPGDKIVSCFTNLIDKKKTVIFSWEDFLKLIKKDSKIYGEYNLKENRKVSQHKMGKQLGVSQTCIHSWERKNRIPLYVIDKLNHKPVYFFNIQNQKIMNPFPLSMSSSLARVLGNLIGDGSIDREKIKRENCFDFRYHNTDINLIKRFINDINKIFGIKLKYAKRIEKEPKKQRYFVRIPSLLGRILYMIAPELIKKDVPKTIFKEFYPEFIGALFDDEGHSTKNEPKIFISGTNFRMLNKLKTFLRKLNIKSKLSKNQFKLYIRGKDNLAFFLEKIPILSLTKKRRLLEYLHKFYRYGVSKTSQFQKEKTILESLLQKGKTSLDLSKIIGLSQVNTAIILKRLIKKGFVKRKVVGISKRPRKKIIYEINKELYNTYYSFIDEDIINEYFITKTLLSINQVQYSGYVYDITNTHNRPNFMLSNGIIVHNSTRADIVENLYQRHYLKEKSIEATELGETIVEVLEKYCPEILDEKLTRHFEEEMEQIRGKTKKMKDVISEAKEILVKISTHFKQNEKKIGEGLLKATHNTRHELTRVTTCPNCKKGELVIRKGRFGNFLACNAYPKCKTTSSLPTGMIKPSDKTCVECNAITVTVIRAGKRPFNYCINKKCKLKEEYKKKMEALKKEDQPKE